MKKKILKQIISTTLLSLFLFQLFIPSIVAAESATETDSEFTRDSAFLKAISIMADGELDNADYKNITRAEFASILIRIFGQEIYSKDSSPAGQNESSTVEKVVNDEWYWEGDKETGQEAKDDDLMSKATPYYDVTNDNQYWNAIRMVSVMGIMGGGDTRYFYPDREITGNEVVKAIVRVLGYDFGLIGQYPDSYVMKANDLKVLKNVHSNDLHGLISMRDLSVILYNALHTEVYEAYQFTNSDVKYRKSDMLLMAQYLRINKIDGIVKKNEYTSLGSLDASAKNTIVVGDQLFYNFTYSAKDLIGKEIIAYYVPYLSDSNKIIYIDDNGSCNEILEIDAKDIDSFANHTLDYHDQKDNAKSIHINAEADVIYNDKALLSYSNADLKPDYGSVTFIDNNDDGTYDVIKVVSKTFIVVETVNEENKIIYDKNQVNNQLDISDADCKIYNTDGKEMLLSDINRWDVLTVKKTLNSQGKMLVEMIVSNALISGEVTEINNSDDDLQLTVSGQTYDVVSSLQQNFQVGDYGQFYLTADNRIAGFRMLPDKGLSYGYIVMGGKLPGVSNTYQLKLYGTDDKVVILSLKDKIDLNDQMVSSEVAYNSLSNHTSGINQIIRYGVNSDGLINTIYTKDATNKLVTSYNGSEKGKYRTNAKALIGTRQIICTNDKTVIMYVPSGDKSDTKNYNIEKFKQDVEYTVSEAYASDSLNTTSDIAILYVDTVSKTVDVSTPVMLIDKVTKISQDGEEQYKICGLVNGVYAEYKCENDDLYDQVKTWRRGDLVRCGMNNNGYMLAAVKVYDVATRKMVSTTNPMISDTNLMSQFCLLHGKAYSKPNESEFIKVAAYDYSNQNALLSQPNQLYSYNVSKFVVQIYDTETGRSPQLGSYLDIKDQVSTGNGDEMLIYTIWSDARTITIYR